MFAKEIFTIETTYGFPFELILEEIKFNEYNIKNKFIIMFYYQSEKMAHKIKSGTIVGSKTWEKQAEHNQRELKKIINSQKLKKE